MNAGERIKAIFAQALEHSSPAEREKYLTEACQGDRELRREIESLLRAGAQAGDFLRKTMQLPQPHPTVELHRTRPNYETPT